jgi:hypothetical protein
MVFAAERGQVPGGDMKTPGKKRPALGVPFLFPRVFLEPDDEIPELLIGGEGPIGLIKRLPAALLANDKPGVHELAQLSLDGPDADARLSHDLTQVERFPGRPIEEKEDFPPGPAEKRRR